MRQPSIEAAANAFISSELYGWIEERVKRYLAGVMPNCFLKPRMNWGRSESPTDLWRELSSEIYHHLRALPSAGKQKL